MSQSQIPFDWFCSLTHTIMTDPVTASDGYTYQNKAIVEWLSKNKASPVTGEPLKAKDLVSNLALKSTIEGLWQEYLKNGGKNVLTGEQIKMRKQGWNLDDDNLGLSVDSMVADKELIVTITVEPPSEQLISHRKPVSIICILDISGSMDTEASIATADAEDNGFTRLDLVKHSVNTIINSLNDNDLLALVPFSDSARVELDLTKMNVDGRNKAMDSLKKIRTEGSTNIWDGVRAGLELTKDQRCSDKNTFVILLTDGEPNVNPPEGILPALSKFLDSSPLSSNLHVFGYGYHLDTVLLTGIATMGLGTYGYIPDCSMVGTIFINFLANALANVTNLVQVKIENVEGVKLLSTGGKTEPVKRVDMGGVQYGQKKSIVLRFTVPEDKEGEKILDVYLNYGRNFRKQRQVTLTTIHPNNRDSLLSEVNRITHIESLLSALSLSKDLPSAQAVIQNLVNVLSSSPILSSDQLTKQILRDITSPNDQQGQVSKAFQKAEWYDKWGKHYIPALILAHSQQICTNFKDPGLQSYGGKLFRELQNEIDTIFIKLPPPEPSKKKQQYSAPVNMAQYNNYYGGCIAGGCDVRMGDGGLRKVRNLKKGDVVKTPNGSSKILCMVKSIINKVIPMVHFPRGLIITPYHPVRLSSSWHFPYSLIPTTSSYISQYYNFVLQQDHIMIVNGMECVSLGHGFKEGEVIEHEYLGTGKVVQDLMKNKEKWESGVVEVGGFVRDQVSQRIMGMLVEG